MLACRSSTKVSSLPQVGRRGRGEVRVPVNGSLTLKLVLDI